MNRRYLLLQTGNRVGDWDIIKRGLSREISQEQRVNNYQGPDGKFHCVLHKSDKVYACGLEREDMGSSYWLSSSSLIESDCPTNEPVTCPGCLREKEKEKERQRE